MRNSALPDQVSGDFSEFRHIWRNFPESRLVTAEPAGWRARGPPDFSGLRGDILHNRPQIHGVWNSATPAQVSGDFAEFRQIWRNFPESRLFTAELAGWRAREPPEFVRIQ